MQLPGFAADVSLYETRQHYRGIALAAAGSGVRQQQLPLAITGGLRCGSCYLDSTGACVKFCEFCKGAQCFAGDIYPCSPSECACGPCNCVCTKNCGATQVPC